MTKLHRAIKKALVSTCGLLAVLLVSAPAALSHLSHGGQSHPPVVVQNAITVTLGSASPLIAKGTTFNVEVGIDFTDLLMGGSLHLDYDREALELVSFSFDPVAGEPIVSDFTESATGGFLTWGWFENLDRFSISGIRRIGVLTLLAKNRGPSSLVSSAVAATQAAGPLVGPGSLTDPLDGAPVNVLYGQTFFSIVPEPGTASMMLLGLLILKLRPRQTR